MTLFNFLFFYYFFFYFFCTYAKNVSLCHETPVRFLQSRHTRTAVCLLDREWAASLCARSLHSDALCVGEAAHRTTLCIGNLFASSVSRWRGSCSCCSRDGFWGVWSWSSEQSLPASPQDPASQENRCCLRYRLCLPQQEPHGGEIDAHYCVMSPACGARPRRFKIHIDWKLFFVLAWCKFQPFSRQGASTSSTEVFGHRAKRARVSGKSHDLPGVCFNLCIQGNKTHCFCLFVFCLFSWPDWLISTFSFPLHRWIIYKTKLRLVRMSLCLFQQRQQSSTFNRSFLTRWFWRSSPTCWSRISVRQPASAKGSASSPTTPSSGQFARAVDSWHCVFFSRSLFEFLFVLLNTEGSGCTWRCLSTRVPWCTLSRAGSIKSALRSTSTQILGRKASNSL